MIADPDLHTLTDQCRSDIGLDIGKADDEVRLERQYGFDFGTGEGTHLRLVTARLHRPDGESGNADDAVLLAERIQHFSRLFGQAHDPPRSGHGYSITCDQTPLLRS